MSHGQRVRTLVLVGLIGALATLPPQASAHDLVKTKFTVMSWNLYVGADLSLLITASPTNFLDRMAKVFRRVQQTDFHERAAAIADQIELYKPDLIGLQEVALWRTQSPADGPISDAHDVAFDFLEILTDELESRGLHYDVLKIFNGFDIEAPGNFSNGLMDVRFTDRDAILARHTHHYEFSNIKKHRFDTEFSIPTGFFGDITYPRAWESVDVSIVGSSKKFRFVNTHLEVFLPSVNEAQAEELVDGPGHTNMRTIFVGDFNAAAGSPLTSAYDTISGAGFQDVWDEEHPGNSGFTCCQDSRLRNDDSELSSRIDFVFIRGAISIRSAARIGEAQADRTESGLWPSDHAGIIAKLQID